MKLISFLFLTHAVQYLGPDRAAMLTYFNYELDYYYYLVYVNPYTAEVFKGERYGSYH